MTDGEINELLAREIMKFTRLICPTNTDGATAAVYIDRITTQERWNPVESIEQSLMVAYRLVSERGMKFRCEIDPQGFSRAGFYVPSEQWEASDIELEMAICLAAVQVVKGAK